MLRTLLHTHTDRAVAMLRVILALIILPHGAQKLFGWFGGYGFEGTMGYFVGLGVPPVFGLLAILVETLGALALLVGLFGRLTALGIGVNMVVAGLLVHLPFGFFINWYGNQAGNGIEMQIVLAAVAAAIVWRGSGAWSVDGRLAGHRLAQPLQLARAAH